MNKILIALSAIVLFGGQITVMGQGQGTKHAPRHAMTVRVDQIDNTNSDGVSRVACVLLGIPHTSSRVDSVTAVIGNKTVKATDIDGVDFGRYFQWEDDSALPVEVDIERHARFNKGDSIKFHTVHGVYTAPLKR